MAYERNLEENINVLLEPNVPRLFLLCPVQKPFGWKTLDEITRSVMQRAK